MGPCAYLLTTIIKRKLKWYSHVTRSTDLAKSIMQSTIQGARDKRKGVRQLQRWTRLRTDCKGQRLMKRAAQCIIGGDPTTLQGYGIVVAVVIVVARSVSLEEEKYCT